MRLLFATILICSTANWPFGSFSEENGFWTEMKVKAYSQLQRNYLKDGKTTYGKNAYQEGCAADKYYYPEGTRFYVTWAQNGEKKGRWCTVDDTHPKTVGKKDMIYIQFLTKRKADSWKVRNCRVHVVLPTVKQK